MVWLGGGVTSPKSYITHKIDFLEIILELKDKYDKWEVRKQYLEVRSDFRLEIFDKKFIN